MKNIFYYIPTTYGCVCTNILSLGSWVSPILRVNSIKIPLIAPNHVVFGAVFMGLVASMYGNFNMEFILKPKM